MEDKLHQDLCKVFAFDNIIKIFSLSMNYDEIDEACIYKNLLFKYCFLSNANSVKVENIKDLWFFKLDNLEEIKIIIGVFELILSKINDKNFDIREKSICLVKNFLDLKDYNKFEIFRLFQSIFSSYEDSPNHIIYPLLYTFGFDEPFICSNNIKYDLKTIAESSFEKMNKFDNIQYNKINKEFLRYFNLFLISKDEKIKKEAYDFLCIFGKSDMKKENNLEKYLETFNYFSFLKVVISDYEKKFKKMKDVSKNMIMDTQYIHNKNGDSTKTTSSDDINHNKTKIEEIKEVHNINTENTENKNKLKEQNSSVNKIDNFSNNYLIISLSVNSMYLDKLCSQIVYILDNFKINTNSIDKYNELLVSNLENKLLLNKLSSTIILLQNANIINIKRKLIETLIFEIIEENKHELCFTSSYFPNNTILIQLKNLILNALNKCDEKEKFYKIKIRNDLDRLEKIINNPENSSNNSFIYLKQLRTKKQKQIKMTLDFLRYCKLSLNPFVHAVGEKINYYVLPRSLFNSNLKYEKYILSLNEMIEYKDNDSKDIENNFNEIIKDDEWRLYKKNKEITKEEVFNILFGIKKFSYMEKIDLDHLNDKKIQLKTNLESFHLYVNSFLQTSLKEFEDKFIITEEAKKKEEDIITKLKNYDEKFSKIMKNEINSQDAIDIINTLKKKIEEQVDDAQKYLTKIRKGDFSDISINKTYEIIDSKVNRIQLIKKFLHDQSEKFCRRQQEIYQDYENSANDVITMSEQIKNKIKERSLSENKCDLIESWLKTNPFYQKKYLKRAVILDNINSLITNVKLDINYSFDDRFVLWAVKNKFSIYLKN